MHQNIIKSMTVKANGTPTNHLNLNEIEKNAPPQFSYRLTRQYNQKSTAFLGMYGVGLSLLLSAPAFSGGDFCVNHLIA